MSSFHFAGRHVQKFRQAMKLFQEHGALSTTSAIMER